MGGEELLGDPGGVDLDAEPVRLAELAGATGVERKRLEVAPTSERQIVAVIDAAKGAGVEKVGIVTEGMRRAAGVQTGN